MCLNEFTQYLHRHIPLSQVMGVSVILMERDSIVLHAPLAPNINHRETVFGGSASALAILASWSVLHLRLRRDGIQNRLVIQRNTMEYQLPIPGGFTAHAELADGQEWQKFTETLTRKGRGRITVRALLKHDETAAGSFTGDFVAFRVDGTEKP